MEYARSSFDIPQSFATSAGYTLPFGHNKRFLANTNGFANAALGGWQLQGIFLAHSGTAFTPTISGDAANIGLTAQRPVQVGIGKLSHPTVSNWFNKAAYALPSPYTYGNASANSLRAGPLKDLDMSLFKIVPLPKDTSMEFRYEVFNLTNTASFLPPSGVIDTGAGATVTATSNDAREMQFAVKLSF
jgi:hypothetical protein